jgi:hypothetical protein
MATPNYLETLNPFMLKAPPAAWLVELLAFDPDLVIFPSAMEPVYRVTKRAGNRPGIQTVAKKKNNDGTETVASLDTQTCWQHRLVPVSSIHPHANWSPVLLQDLGDRSISRFGGHEAVSRMFEEREQSQHEKLERDERDDIGQQAGFAYRSIRWASGETIDPQARRRSSPPTKSGYRRVMQTRGNHRVEMTELSPAEQKMLVTVPAPVRDRGLVQLTDG